MIANYGYKDGAGDWFISIDTNKCNGCGECVKACPYGVFKLTEDPNDPFREGLVAVVSEEERNKIKYTCGPCKSVTKRLEGTLPPLPCVSVCQTQSISHSW